MKKQHDVVEDRPLPVGNLQPVISMHRVLFFTGADSVSGNYALAQNRVPGFFAFATSFYITNDLNRLKKDIFCYEFDVNGAVVYTNRIIVTANGTAVYTNGVILDNTGAIVSINGVVVATNGATVDTNGAAVALTKMGKSLKFQ